MIPSWQLLGYEAHLVLEDEDGDLFEIRTPVSFATGEPKIDVDRVIEAIDERAAQKAPASRWPVF
jgi:hypothetical protein